jgi:hypothetical protein
MAAHRLRISDQQRQLLTALALVAEQESLAWVPGLTTRLLTFAVWGRGDGPYPYMEGENYKSLCRSLDRLTERGLIRKERRPVTSRTRNGYSRRLGHPLFRITTAGLEYLDRTNSRRQPHPYFCDLLERWTAGEGQEELQRWSSLGEHTQLRVLTRWMTDQLSRTI